MSFDTFNNFDLEENKIIRIFEHDHQEANKRILKILGYFKDYLLSIGPVAENDYPKSTINLFIGSNFDLLYQSYNLLKRGYFRPAIILLRPVFESIVLCMYFVEFPEKEKEYRNAKRKIAWLNEQNRSKGIIETIEKSGRIFNKDQIPDFLKNLVASPLAEINKIIHFDHKYLFPSLISTSSEGMVLGPKNIDIGLRNIFIVHLLEAALFSLTIMEKAVKPFVIASDDDLNEIVDFINLLKKQNQNLFEG